MTNILKSENHDNMYIIGCSRFKKYKDFYITQISWTIYNIYRIENSNLLKVCSCFGDNIESVQTYIDNEFYN